MIIAVEDLAMPKRLMVLPSEDPERIRLLRIPEDFESHEAFRHVTGIIAEIEARNPDLKWEDLVDALEDKGFTAVKFILGPSLD